MLAIIVVITACIASFTNTISPDGIVVHHTALSREDLRRFPQPTNAKQIDQLHKDRGFRVFYWGWVYHIGYHYLILPDGTIQSGRPERCVGSHTEGHNNMLGICLVGNFSSSANPNGQSGEVTPTESQRRALVSLLRKLSAVYNIPCQKISRHRDLDPRTLCPGDRLPWKQIRADLGCEQVE